MGSTPSKGSRQSKIDMRNLVLKGTPKRAPKRTLDQDTSEDELQAEEDRSIRVGLPVRAKSNGMFSSSDVKATLEESSSESQSEAEKPVKTKATRGGRKRQRAPSSDEDEVSVTVIQRKRTRHAEPEDEADDDELRVPNKRWRGKRRESTPEVDEVDSEEEMHIALPRSVRRRLTKRPATPDEQKQTPPRNRGQKARRQQVSSDDDEAEQEEGSRGESGDAEEQEELKEELAFLRSSPLPDRSRLRSTQNKPKNKRQEALKALKRRRASSTQEPSSTPARKTRTVIESDSNSESELEVIKEEPDSDEIRDPQSEEDDEEAEEEEDRSANCKRA